MQIFIQLSTGKTISMDVTKETIFAEVLRYVNEYHTDYQYQNLLFIKDYGDGSYVITADKNKILNLDTSLISLYSNGIIKEILLLAC